MANKKYYWLKLHDDFFASKRIKKLRKLGSDFVIIYLKLQLLSLQKGGILEFTGIEEDFAGELALDIDEDVDKVQLTISYLQSCGLLEINDNNEFFLPYVEKCTGSETKWANIKRNYRIGHPLDNVQLPVGQSPIEKEKEKDIDKEIDKDINRGRKETQREMAERIIKNFDVSDALKDATFEWIDYKVEKKAKYVEKGMSALIKKISAMESQYGTSNVIEVIDLSMSNNYQGILWDKIKKPTNNVGGNRDLLAELERV